MNRPIARRLLASDSLGVFAVIIVVVLVVLPFRPNYFAGDNVIAMMTVLSVTGMIGLSQMIVMSTGGMNIAIGGVGSLCAVLAGVFMGWLGMGPILAVALALAFGVICGFITGFFTLRSGGVGVASFLATLALWWVFAGISLSITRANAIYNLPPSFLNLQNSNLGGIPLLFLVLVVVAVFVALFFRYLKTGRQLLAFGANWRAAELYGVSRTRVILVAHVAGCVLAALAGVMTDVRIQAAQSAIGADWILTSLAAPILGGTILSGGRVNILGTILGAVVLTLIANGLIQFNVDVYWNVLVSGLVVLGVAGLNRARAVSARQSEA